MGRHQKFEVVLTEEQRQELLSLVRHGTNAANRIRRAQTLLYSDRQVSNSEIARLLHVDVKSVRLTQRRFVEEGLASALHDRPRSGRPREVSKREEAELTAIACSAPPAGRSRWTLRLIRDRYVALDEERESDEEAVERPRARAPRTISHEKVRQVLKKTC